MELRLNSVELSLNSVELSLNSTELSPKVNLSLIDRVRESQSHCNQSQSSHSLPLCRKLEALLMRAISARPPKIRVGVLGQCEGGGSEYLIRKIGARADFNKILIFLQNTLENVTERYL